MVNQEKQFQSFWMAGFECSDQLNEFGYRVDMLEETDHLNQLESDYARLEAFGFKVVREGIRWSQVERTPDHYDWRAVSRIMATADRFGLQVVWDLCHFGFPDDLTPLHPQFPQRFANLCEAFASLHARLMPGQSPIIVPINETGFLSWLGGDARSTSPFCVNHGWEVKYDLMRAFIEGVKRIRKVLPDARIMTVEPLVSITTSSDDPAVVEAAARHCEDQFQSINMLLGRMCPELGGRPEYLDIMGFNYYFNNQWDFETNRLLDWHPAASEPMRKSVSQMLAAVYERYRLPFIISETSHPKEDRPIWMEMVGQNVHDTLRQGLPLLGVCIYPIIDRPDWDYPGHWHHSGLWDNPDQVLPPARMIDEPYAAVLRRWQSRIPLAARHSRRREVFPKPPVMPVLVMACEAIGRPSRMLRNSMFI